MSSEPSFTGRSRRRTTRPSVRFGDALARAVITAGGIGTIAAVLLMGVFLVAVALPLFRPASIGTSRSVSFAGDVPGVVALGSDDTGTVGWSLDVAAGRMRLVDLGTGRVLADMAAAAGLEGATVLRVLPGGVTAVAGFADGSFRTARVGVESSFVTTVESATAADAAVGEAVPAEGGALLRGGPDRWTRIVPVAVADGESTRVLGGRIVDVDLAPLGAGTLVAAVDHTGTIRIERLATKRNMLTGKTTTQRSGGTIDPGAAEGAAPPFRAAFVRVGGNGDQLWAVAADGRARRYAVRDVAAPRLMESFDASGGEPVTAVERLFGGAALAVGDAGGTIRVFFASRQPESATEDGLNVVEARSFVFPSSRPVVALAASPRSRLFAAADAAGDVRLLQSTTGATVLGTRAVGEGLLSAPPRALAVAARERQLLAADGAGLVSWAFDPGHPEVAARTLFGRVWYENYPGAVHAWETTGHETFESKFGFVPLVFGTLKATLYSMAFATPIAILAAIFSTQFLHPAWRARIKPAIEMMASLPSVVLGFVAGLVLAPLVEERLATVIASFFVVPAVLVTGGHLWQLLPAGTRMRLAPWRLPFIGCVGLPAGVAVAATVAPVVERFLFGGDLRAWLDGRGGSGTGGWVLALLPLTVLGVTLVVGRQVNPWLRRASVGWGTRQAGLASLAVFLVGALAALALAGAAGTFLDSLHLDTRGGIFGSYVQRNAMVVAFGMSFAIIPLIFTIADDAMASVPDHLRSASLGAGATPWQTAIRVILPAATSGIFSAVMIGLGRAVGETMVVLMAAGNTPIIDANLFNGFQTLSAAIATELPEAARGSGHYRVLFLAAVALFAFTFVLNTGAEIVRDRFRRRSYEL